MSETMIERCARAIDPDAWRDCSEEPKIIRDRATGRRDVSLRKANAVLLAMRNPTAEMVEAGLSAVSDVTVREPKETAWDALRFHRAMIDEALK